MVVISYLIIFFFPFFPQQDRLYEIEIWQKGRRIELLDDKSYLLDRDMFELKFDMKIGYDLHVNFSQTDYYLEKEFTLEDWDGKHNAEEPGNKDLDVLLGINDILLISYWPGGLWNPFDRIELDSANNRYSGIRTVANFCVRDYSKDELLTFGIKTIDKPIYITTVLTKLDDCCNRESELDRSHIVINWK